MLSRLRGAETGLLLAMAIPGAAQDGLDPAALAKDHEERAFVTTVAPCLNPERLSGEILRLAAAHPKSVSAEIIGSKAIHPVLPRTNVMLDRSKPLT